MTHDTYGPDCACRNRPPAHEDDSYGACTVCREYVPHTDDEYRTVPFPCASVALGEMTAKRDLVADEMVAARNRAHDAQDLADRLAVAVSFTASEDVGGLSGADLLRVIALLLDKRDDEVGNPNRTVQSDLRRWADGIDAALAKWEASR